MGLAALSSPLDVIGRFELHRSAKFELPACFSPGVQYVKVYIRIRTDLYRRNGGHPGWQNDEDRLTFERHTTAALNESNMIVDGSYARTFGDVPEQLYIHPDHFNGVVSLDRLVNVVNALKKSPASRLEWIDIYAFAEQLDDDEKLNRLAYSEPRLIRRIVEAANTRKRNTFRELVIFEEYGLADTIPGLQFVEHYSKGMGACGVCQWYLTDLLQRLVNKGLLYRAQKDGHVFYRAPLKGELKAIPKADRELEWQLVESVLWAK